MSPILKLFTAQFYDIEYVCVCVCVLAHENEGFLHTKQLSSGHQLGVLYFYSMLALSMKRWHTIPQGEDLIT